MLYHLCIFVVLICGQAFSISSPSELTREVGEDVVFMFNGTEFLEALWGVLKDKEDVAPALVRILHPGGDNIIPIAELNSSRYAGRVSFVGDLTKGQAWFKITNLNINDTNKYLAKIMIKGGSQYEFRDAKLTVVQPGVPTTDHTSLTSTGISKHDPTTFPTTKESTLTKLTAHIKVDETFSEEMEDINSNSFQEFSKKFESMIVKLYKDDHNFKSVKVISLRDGSIDVTFVIFFKKEIKFEEACTSLETKTKSGDLGNLKVVQDSLRCNDNVNSSITTTPSPSTGVHPGIIAGVVIAGIIAIAGLVIAILFVCRKKASQKDYRGSKGGVKYAMEVREGEPEEQYASVIRPDAPGTAIAHEDDKKIQYAVVDKSKKKKKREPGELVYAELDHERNQSMSSRPSSDRRATGGSDTVYADIQKQPQQQQYPPPQYGNLQPVDYA